MIIPDVNILIHAYNSDYPHHEAARGWWEQALNGSRPIGLPWVVALGFIRITTNRFVMTRPLSVSKVVEHLRSWLIRPLVRIVHPGDQHESLLFQILEELGTAGNLTTDAHVAALAIEYQAEIASADTDFDRFSKVRWFNPLRFESR